MTPRFAYRWGLAAIAVAILCDSGAATAGIEGEGQEKSLTAKRATSAPTIDGRLSEGIWNELSPDDRFRQNVPIDGAAPSMRTTVRVAFDDDFLYVGVEAHDPEPHKVSARLARRDSLIDADYIELFLDTRHNHDTGYWFRINAAGVIADGEVHDDTRINVDWDAVWFGKAAITSFGWSAEIAIPLSILRFESSDNPEFGFNVTRGIRRLGETVQWVYVPRASSGELSRAGHIQGLRGIKPKRIIELRPFAVAQIESSLAKGGTALLGAGSNIFGASAGLDAKVGITEGLTLDATVNPDFGQVEADPVVLNLTSFEAFFPEKRPFFLGGAGLFTTDIGLINSRRVGQRTTRFEPGSTFILDDGSEVDVVAAPLAAPTYGALRLSGRIGADLSLNTLSAVTGPEVVTIRDGTGLRDIEVAPSRNYSVARAKYALGGSSYLGMAATGVTRFGESSDPQSNHDSYAESIDGRWVRSDGMIRAYFQLATAHRHGGDTYEEGDDNCANRTDCRELTRLDGTIIGPGDVGSAAEFGAAKAGGALRLYNRYRWVSPRFDVDALGFENDWDYHDLLSSNSYQYEKEFLWFQRGQLGLSAQTQFAFDGTRKYLSLRAEASALTKSFWRGDAVVEYKPAGSFTSRESLDGAYFEQSDELRGGLDFESDSRGDIRGGTGANYLISPTSELREVTGYAFASVRPTPPLELALQTDLAFKRGQLRVVSCTAEAGSCWRRSQIRDYELALQDSQSLNITARVNWALSPRLSFEGYMQIFAAGGDFRDYRRIDGLSGPRPLLRRSATVPTNSTGDGSFSFATLNTNLVTRWEMTPGTTLIAVYTRAQRHRRERNRLAVSGLRAGAADEVFLLKFTYYYNR